MVLSIEESCGGADFYVERRDGGALFRSAFFLQNRYTFVATALSQMPNRIAILGR